MSTAPSIAGNAGTSSSISALRKVFSFPVALCAMLSVLDVFTVRARFSDPDLWWHLKTGQIIWTTHRIPTTDLFSYTTNHHARPPQEWLSQVLIYGAYRWAGYTGLMIWLCVFATLLVIASYILCSLYSKNSKTAFIGALTVWLFATVGLAIRPLMIGYLFIVVELLIIHLGLERNVRWLYWLVPLFAVWVNCHGSFFLGILVLGVFLFCSFFDFRLGSLVALHRKPAQSKTLSVVFFLSTGALFLNPDGIHQLLYPLQTMFQLTLTLNVVDEWKPLQINDPRGLCLLIVLGCIALISITRRSDLFWHELLLLILATDLAMSHRRMVFVFGLLAAPIFSRQIAPLWDNYDAERDFPLANAALIIASIMAAFVVFPSRANLARQVDGSNPVKAVEYIEAHHISGNMLNAWDYGGYLIWAMPDHPVFVDGRADVFEWTGVLDDFAKWAQMESNPNDLLNKWDISFCLLEKDSAVVQLMRLLPGWKLVYSDNLSVIFVRDTPYGSP